MIDKTPMKHIIFTYRGNVYQSYKDWSIDRIERVLYRIGATFWDIGSDDLIYIKE